MAGPAELVQGKLFIALILNVMLFGINVTQTYFYYIHSKKDRLWIKISVVIIFLADFIQPLFLSIYLYRTLIVHFGDETTLSAATNLLAVVPTKLTALTASFVQIFFAWRIQILTGIWYHTAFIVATAILSGVCAIAVAYEGGVHPQFLELRVFTAFKVVAVVGYVLEMLGDIMITSILVWFLMVDSIICFSIRTGLLTLIFTGVALISFLMNLDGTYLLFNFITSKLYTSSLLSSLNSRQGWGYDTSENTGELDSDFGLRFATNSSSDSESTTTEHSVAIITPVNPSISFPHEAELKH